jgi:hypothetical protein
MLESDRMRERLAALARTRRAAVPARDTSASSPLEYHGRVNGGPGVEEFLPGGEWRCANGAVYVHERLRSEMERPARDWGLLGTPSEDEEDLAALAASGLARALFLDLETGGLASSPVFLAGTMHWNGSDFVLRQYFARHYGEEAALLCALHELARGFDYLITFNGKSYDAPFLLGRAAVNAVRVELPGRHVDLLHPARRRWKGLLPNCRLQTLELHVCRRRRSGDVPGEEIPGLYHDFVRRGDPYRLIPVFHHNMLDVITMAEILRALCMRRARARHEEDHAELDFACDPFP